MGFLVLILTLVLGGLVLVGGLQWIQAAGRRGRVEQTVHTPGQLDRIETALSALEARVDDLQDQQRFLERLLADRPEPPRLTGGGGDARTGSGEERVTDQDSVLFDTREGTKPADEGER